MPGDPAVPVAGYPFYLMNNGGTPLALSMSVISAPSNPDNVDLPAGLAAGAEIRHLSHLYTRPFYSARL